MTSTPLQEAETWPRRQRLAGVCTCCGVKFEHTLLVANEGERAAAFAAHIASVTGHSKACWQAKVQSAAHTARLQALQEAAKVAEAQGWEDTAQAIRALSTPPLAKPNEELGE